MKRSNNIDVARTVRQSVNATRITCNNGLTTVFNVMVVLSDARIKVAKALRSDMEALNRVESGGGCRERILAYFLPTEHFCSTYK